MTREAAEKALADLMQRHCDTEPQAMACARIAADAIERAVRAAHSEQAAIIYQLIAGPRWQDHNDTLGKSTHAAAVESWEQACDRRELPIPWSAVLDAEPKEGGEK